MRVLKYLKLLGLVAFLFSTPIQATIISVTGCTATCTITNTPPNPVTPDPNNGVLLLWNERQNITLTENLTVNRVFDTSASFIQDNGNGTYDILAGTIVSSHYIQWDPLLNSQGGTIAGTISATINLDSEVFAFITQDAQLFASDEALGLPGLDYNDFGLRGLEFGDTTSFVNNNTEINWTATSPGDWSRLITAFSPTAERKNIPEPSTFILCLIAIMQLFKRR
ncbi:hypothetical protein HR060_00955 [Catenovulum sp. SM1970]|uniref:hypothetical protein n=1 Tax=Marinifaba aquimaris TaxID=2741323 RepID=UPI0015745468|nr:hypothetical protein [Marinifaba aquimaris]NTS75419.1 hypothetical protein [Marinifaba aquimaris]